MNLRLALTRSLPLLVVLVPLPGRAQPSGGPYGPIPQTYRLPEKAAHLYYVAPDGRADAAGAAVDAPTALDSAVARVVTGDAIILRGGVYRTGNLVLNQGTTLQPYADEKPVLKGTEVVQAWEAVGGNVWRASWSKLFPSKRDQALFLPNINLHPPMEPARHDPMGYDTLKRFVQVRIDPGLIDEQALEQAVTYSGGVFREMARIMRTAIGRARRRHAACLELDDVEWAATEIRNEYRRILDKEDLKLLRRVHENNHLEYTERMRPLMQLLALLEYRNGENWCDVHPVLRKLLDD